MTEEYINCTAIGMRVRRLREEHGMTREQLAEKIDISSKFLYEVEMGKCTFNIRILIRLSEIFCVSADYLLFGENVDFLLTDRSGREEQRYIEDKEREHFKYILREILNL